MSADTLAPVLSQETQSQVGWVGPETAPSPGAAASTGAHYMLHSSCVRIARTTCKGGTEKTGERAVGGAQRRAGSARFGGSCLRGGEGGGSAELGPRRQLQPRPLAAALAAHGVQPPAPTSLLPTRRLGARGRLSPGPASACVPAPARPFLLLLPAVASWAFVSGGRPSRLGRRSPPLGFCGFPDGAGADAACSTQGPAGRAGPLGPGASWTPGPRTWTPLSAFSDASSEPVS